MMLTIKFENCSKPKAANFVVVLISMVVLFLPLGYFETHPGQNLAPSLKITQAATISYQAKIINYKPAQKIKLKANTGAVLKTQYKNMGRTSWLNTGASAIKVKAIDSAKDFIHKQWIDASTPTKLFWPKISQGEAIWFEVPIKTPKINGSYTLNFSLSAGKTPISNSTAKFEITVYGGQPAPKTQTNGKSQTAGRTEVFKLAGAQKNKLPFVFDPPNNLSFQVKSGDEILLQKTGDKIQISFDFSAQRYFVNDQNGNRLLMSDQALKFIPGDQNTKIDLSTDQNYSFCGNLEFAYQPDTQNFVVTHEGKTDCQPKLIVSETFWQTIPSEINIADDYRFQEPTVRVGLFYQEPDKKNQLPLQIHTLNQVPYDIKTESNNLVTRATAGDLLSINYDFSANRYFINSNGQRIAMTDEPLRFVGLNPETIFEIASWENGPFWGMDVNDNDYRGNLEIQFNPSTNRLWIINELPMETYLRGIMEVWDSWPYEFLKAQKIAARTYAMFRYLNPKYTNTPDEEPIFTLRATQADQVYRGYQAELRNPNTVKAVQETRGMVAIYNNDPILAYYFAQSDGRTRSSAEAGMTKDPVPYLISKNDPPGQGKTLRGHGVGLPQTSGKVAAEQGANLLQILKYYYTGIDVKRLYP